MDPIFPEARPQSWDNLAHLYDSKILPLTRPYAEDALRLVGLARGQKLLDVAAGTGAATLLAAAQGAEVTAIDFAPAMVGELRARVQAAKLQNVRVEVMDGQALDLPESAFDAAVSVFGLNFFPDRVRGMREMRRTLKPGGRAAIVSWGPPQAAPFLPLVREAATRAGIELPPPPGTPPLYSLADPKKFEAEMLGAGFADVRIEPVQREWDVQSPDGFWAGVEGTPVMAVLTQQVGAERLGDVRKALAGLVEERYGTSPRIPVQAWAGLGRRG